MHVRMTQWWLMSLALLSAVLTGSLLLGGANAQDKKEGKTLPDAAPAI